MSQIKTASDIKKLGTILSVWAHPDDESFTAAGIMATASRNGQTVVCVTATKGEAGVQDETRWPARKLGQIRQKELSEALKLLKLSNHFWLGYKDGHCHEIPSDLAAAQIRRLIKRYVPDTILTFGPDGITGHADHQTISEWVSRAVINENIAVYHTVEEERRYFDYMIEADKKFNIYFNIDSPPVLPSKYCDIAYNLPPDILAKKRAALKAMPSQTEAMFKNTPPATMKAMLELECFVLAQA